LPPHLTQSPHHVTAAPQHDMAQRQNSALRPWLAAALSLLCGLGQLYNGQTVKGIVCIALGTAAVISWHLPIGKFILPTVWLYAMIDAYIVARRSVSDAT
jgi:TM2 domain-containing membrane protein YozV